MLHPSKLASFRHSITSSASRHPGKHLAPKHESDCKSLLLPTAAPKSVFEEGLLHSQSVLHLT